MRYYFFVIVLSLFQISFLLSSYSFVWAEEKIIINEIFPNPKGRDFGKEFIELHNNSSNEVILKNWILRRISKKGIIKNYKFKDVDKIKKGEYYKVKFSILNND